MAYTYDTTTDVGKVRLLIRDNVADANGTMNLTDAEITIFLNLSGSVVWLAAAWALRNLATNEAYLANALSIGGYDSTRQQKGAVLDDLARRFEQIASEEGRFTAAVEMDWSDTSYADRVWREATRESGEYLGGATE